MNFCDNKRMKAEQVMRKAEAMVTWVVYQVTIHGRQDAVNAVCEQAEWEALQARKPGHHKLVRSGITTETEAEKLARGTSGDTRSSRARRL
jgi:hypothetical protein